VRDNYGLKSHKYARITIYPHDTKSNSSRNPKPNPNLNTVENLYSPEYTVA